MWRNKNIKSFDNAVTGDEALVKVGDDNSFAYNPFIVKSFLFKGEYWQPTNMAYPVKMDEDPMLEDFDLGEEGHAKKLMKEFMVHYGIFGNCLGFSTKDKKYNFTDVVDGTDE